MDQLDLLNAKDDIMSVASWLRNYMREARDNRIPWVKRAKDIKGKLYLLKEYLRNNYSKDIYPNREQEEWFEPYVSLWESISQAYAVAKTYTWMGATTKVNERKRLEISISFRTREALNSFEEFIERYTSYGSNEELKY